MIVHLINTESVNAESLIMTRASRRGPWLPEEDSALVELVRTQGPNNWVRISQQLQHRSPKQCRERYHQNLKPSLNHEPISSLEGEMIEQMVDEMGKRWAEIARRLGNRSDNAVKNWWNGSMNRRKRNSSQSSSTKQIGNRLHPIATMRSPRSYYGLPPGVFTNRGDLRHDTSLLQHRWSTPEASSRTQHRLDVPSTRLQSRSETNLLHTQTEQYSFPVVQLAQHGNPAQSDFVPTPLPPLLLPPLLNQQASSHQGVGKTPPSPVPTECSQTPFLQSTQSHISDTLSTHSTPPSTMLSPLFDHPSHIEASEHTSPRHVGSPPFRFPGIFSQRDSPPSMVNASALTLRPYFENKYPNHSVSIDHMKSGLGHTFHSGTSPHQPRDTRMQLSNLVQ